MVPVSGLLPPRERRPDVPPGSPPSGRCRSPVCCRPPAGRMRDRSPSAKGPLSGPCRRAWDTFRLHPHSCCFLCAYRVAVSSLHCSICHIWVPSGNSLFVLADSECKLRATLVILLPAAGRSVLPMLRTKSGCCRKPAKTLQAVGMMHTGRTAPPGRGLAQDLHFPSRYPAAIRAAPLRPLRYGGRETSMP